MVAPSHISSGPWCTYRSYPFCWSYHPPTEERTVGTPEHDRSIRRTLSALLEHLWPKAVSEATLATLKLHVPGNAHPYGHDLLVGVLEVLTGW